MIFFTLMMIAMTLNGFLARTAFAKYYLLALCLIILAMLVFINQVLLRALRNPYFFSMDDQNNSPDPAREKPIPSGRNQDELEEMLPIIIKYMQDEKPFLEPELTLQQLAARLSLKPKMLSLVINEKLGRNFFDFINHYRIEEAKRMLTNPEDKKITILEVLYEVGFNSKSSFNTLFKKYTGLTPSAFKQQQIL
jgi:AraC-like DNA-binding protein